MKHLASTCAACTALQDAASCINSSMSLIAALPAYSRDGSRFCEYLEKVVSHVSNMTEGQSVLLPGGWAKDAGPRGFVATAIPLVLSRRPSGQFALAVCNAGEGNEYYPMAPDSATGELLQALFEAQQLADRIAILRRGEIAAAGTPAAIAVATAVGTGVVVTLTRFAVSLAQFF